MNVVILVFVKDYDVDGEWNIWEVCSPSMSDKDIGKMIQDAKNNGIIGWDAEYYTEEWSVWDSSN